MNRFDGINLSTEPSLARIAKTVARARVEIIIELAQELFDRGDTSAAKYLQDKAATELKEVGL